MFRRAVKLRNWSRVYSSHSVLPPGRNAAFTVASLAAAGTGVAIWYSTQSIIHNDAAIPEQDPVQKARNAMNTGISEETGHLVSLVWGSNKSNIIATDVPDVDSIKSPAIADWLDSVALRDLALHETHAVCIDARGDVYQWGDGFFGTSSSSDGPSSRKPTLTLSGKNITRLQVTESRVFALSASGRIYVLSAKKDKQVLDAGQPTPSSQPWWSTGWLWGEEEVVDFSEISPKESLSWGEKFVSIAAGRDHLLALTSTGRTYAHPVTKNANTHGQLGFRKFDIPGQASSARLNVELTPKSIADPYSKTSSYSRPFSATTSPELASLDDSSIRFSDSLFEIPSLKGVKVKQIAAGSRSSYVNTIDGKVLGWGANEFGQLGLGSLMTLDTITVPTEIVLSRPSSSRSRTKCVDVTAGGDLACFTVEVSNDKSPTSFDVLMCGNGQWGGLGNGSFTNSQGAPGRAKNVSGLLEFSEASQKLEAIKPHAVSVSPTGHVLLTLDTHARSGPGGGGHDLVVWGTNLTYQLGNGKRSSVPTPTALDLPDGNRFMLMKSTSSDVRVVKDLKGKTWKRGGGVVVEQCAATGYGNSVVYWRLC